MASATRPIGFGMVGAGLVVLWSAMKNVPVLGTFKSVFTGKPLDSGKSTYYPPPPDLGGVSRGGGAVSGTLDTGPDSGVPQTLIITPVPYMNA